MNLLYAAFILLLSNMQLYELIFQSRLSTAVQLNNPKLSIKLSQSRYEVLAMFVSFTRVESKKF